MPKLDFEDRIPIVRCLCGRKPRLSEELLYKDSFHETWDHRYFCKKCFMYGGVRHSEMLARISWRDTVAQEMKIRSKPLDFNSYQERARKTAIYPRMGEDPIYPALGLCGEAGEVAEKVKKLLRDDNGVISPSKRAEVKKELGDVLWYVANLCYEFGLDLEDVAIENLQKLASRAKRGKLQGSGDNR